MKTRISNPTFGASKILRLNICAATRKTLLSLTAGILCALAQLRAPAQQTPAISNLLNRGYQIVERAQHHRVFARTTLTTNADGTVTATTNKVTQLSTGLHRWASNRWVEARPTIVPAANGFVAQGAGHQAVLASNANSYAAIQLYLPDGTNVLQMHVLGLAWHDLSTGSNVMFSVLQDSIGQIISNRVVYNAAFSDGVSGQLRYAYTLHQSRAVTRDRLSTPPPRFPAATSLRSQSSVRALGHSH